MSGARWGVGIWGMLWLGTGCGSTWNLDDRDGDGFVWLYGDCDDNDPNIHPLAEEVCDAIDNDCDGLVDPADASGTLEWFGDKDGDGFPGNEVVISACEQPTGYALEWTDCNDSNGGINPDTLEYCDGVDNNCDEDVDEASALDAETWYRDADGDGFGDAADVNGVRSCDAPTGYVGNNQDCDDNDEDVNPDAEEVEGDGVDNDCSGSGD